MFVLEFGWYSNDNGLRDVFRSTRAHSLELGGRRRSFLRKMNAKLDMYCKFSQFRQLAILELLLVGHERPYGRRLNVRAARQHPAFTPSTPAFTAHVSLYDISTILVSLLGTLETLIPSAA